MGLSVRARRLVVEEPSGLAQELIALLDEGQMAAAFEDAKPRSRDAFGEHPRAFGWEQEVVASDDDQRGRPDLVKSLRHVPPRESPVSSGAAGLAVDDVPDRPVGDGPFRVRQVEPGHRSPPTLQVLVGPHLRAERPHRLVRGAEPCGQTHHRLAQRAPRVGVAQHHRGEPVRVGQRVLQRDEATVRVAQQRHPLAPEVRADRVDVIGQTLEREGVAGARRAPVRSLVEEDQRPPVSQRIEPRPQVRVVQAQTAVQRDQQIAIADDLEPQRCVSTDQRVHSAPPDGGANLPGSRLPRPPAQPPQTIPSLASPADGRTELVVLHGAVMAAVLYYLTASGEGDG